MKERCVLWKLQRGLTAQNSQCNRWNTLEELHRVPDNTPQQNGRDFPFLSNVTCFGVTFCRRMTCDTIPKGFFFAQSLLMYIRTYYLFRSWRLSTNVKLYRAPIRSTMFHMAVRGGRSLLGRLNKVRILDATGRLARCIIVREFARGFQNYFRVWPHS